MIPMQNKIASHAKAYMFDSFGDQGLLGEAASLAYPALKSAMGTKPRARDQELYSVT